MAIIDSDAMAVFYLFIEVCSQIHHTKGGLSIIFDGQINVSIAIIFPIYNSELIQFRSKITTILIYLIRIMNAQAQQLKDMIEALQEKKIPWEFVDKKLIQESRRQLGDKNTYGVIKEFINHLSREDFKGVMTFLSQFHLHTKKHCSKKNQGLKQLQKSLNNHTQKFIKMYVKLQEVCPNCKQMQQSKIEAQKNLEQKNEQIVKLADQKTKLENRIGQLQQQLPTKNSYSGPSVIIDSNQLDYEQKNKLLQNKVRQLVGKVREQLKQLKQILNSTLQKNKQYLAKVQHQFTEKISEYFKHLNTQQESDRRVQEEPGNLNVQKDHREEKEVGNQNAHQDHREEKEVGNQNAQQQSEQNFHLKSIHNFFPCFNGYIFNHFNQISQPQPPFNIPQIYYSRLAVFDQYQNQIKQMQENLELRTRLIEMIEKDVNKQIVATKLIFHSDGLSHINPHKYIDNRPNYAIIIQLTNGNIIGAFSESPLRQQDCDYKGNGFVFTLNNNRKFKIESKIPGAKFMDYNPYYIVFGNSELRIQLSKNEVFSNFGIAQSFFRPKQNSEVLFGVNKKQSQIAKYEVHQVFFKITN